MLVNIDILNLNRRLLKENYARVAFEEPRLEWHEKIGHHVIIHFFLIKQNEIVCSTLSLSQEKRVKQYARKLATAHLLGSEKKLSGKKAILSQVRQTNYFIFRVKKR